MTVLAPKRRRVDVDAMTLTEHLGELRRRLVVCLVAFVLGGALTYAGYNELLHLVREPLCRANPGDCSLYAIGPLEGFAVRLDVTGYGGLILASPVILFQLWRFVTPGLKANERRYALPFVVASTVLFLFGAYVAWLTFPHALGFLRASTGTGIKQLITTQKYVNLLLALMAIFGLTFEFPIVLVALELARVITPAQLRRFRRYAFLIIIIAAGVLTPSSDPFSMLAMALPMLVFYELSIVVGRVLRR